MLTVMENSRTGQIVTCEVPEPELRPGTVLVRTAFSVISSGTERAKIEMGSKSLVGKAMSRPDLVKQVLDVARTDGIRTAYDKVKARLDSLSPVGYSCAGTVLEVGEGVSDLRPGDRVACGGAGYANHSEINVIPRNLVVQVPDGVGLDAAAMTTIGAIAVQGLRQGEIRFGETVAVVGAGLVGLLAIQIARAAGCHVIAADLNEGRVEFARQMGAELAVSPADPDARTKIMNASQYGADVVIIAAATRSADPLNFAASIARDRGRIVVLGDVGMGVARGNMYAKELALTMSRSYGPGRYDADYEERGMDYPVGYVRWTERRNMESFLKFLATGAITATPLLKHRFLVGEADKAYEAVTRGGAYTGIIEYPAAPESQNVPVTPVKTAVVAPHKEDLRIGCIGAGGFARGVMIPILKASKNVTLSSVATGSGTTAESARRAFGFVKAQTPAHLISDPDLEAVFVFSRHDTHAEYVMKALGSQKAVFVEKPLAVTREQLESIRQLVSSQAREGRSPFLMVGYNRRFAPFTEEIRKFFADRTEPMIVHARVNAGYIARDHWIQQEGGRIIGEGCHFLDWARSVVGSPIHSVAARALPNGARYSDDNVAILLTFRDGSIANILYTANGDKSVSKEYFEVFCEGRVARLDDFCSLELSRNNSIKRMKSARDKGHKRELALTLEAMRKGVPSPIALEDLFEISEAAIAVTEVMASGKTVVIGPDAGDHHSSTTAA